MKHGDVGGCKIKESFRSFEVSDLCWAQKAHHRGGGDGRGHNLQFGMNKRFCILVTVS